MAIPAESARGGEMSLDTARTSACATRLQKSIVYELLTQDTSNSEGSLLDEIVD
jgi:hypothetical protein